MREIAIGSAEKFSEWKEALAFETQISLALLERDIENGARAVALLGAIAIRLMICPGDDILLFTGAFTNQVQNVQIHNGVIPPEILVKKPEIVGRGKKGK